MAHLEARPLVKLYDGKWEPVTYLAQLENELDQLELDELQAKVSILRARAELKRSIRKVIAFITSEKT